MSKFTLVLDSSQIAAFLECETLWYNQYVKRLVPSAIVPSDAMNAGTYGHKLLDIYYRLRRRGLPLNEAAAQAFTYDPDKDNCECGCPKEFHKDVPIFNIKECHKCKHCLNYRPKPFPLPVEIRMAVQNRLREYFFTYQSNDFVPLSEQHVEVGFSEPIFEDSQNLFVLEGRIDMLATLQGLQVVVDHKFQMRSHTLYNKAIQFRNYALIAKQTMMIINYIRLAQKVNKDTLVRDIVSFTVPELLAWKVRLIDIFKRVKYCIQSDSYQQNWGACPGKYNYQCYYTPLCEESNPQIIQIKEKQLFTVKEEVWRPW